MDEKRQIVRVERTREGDPAEEKVEFHLKSRFKLLHFPSCKKKTTVEDVIKFLTVAFDAFVDDLKLS